MFVTVFLTLFLLVTVSFGQGRGNGRGNAYGHHKHDRDKHDHHSRDERHHYSRDRHVHYDHDDDHDDDRRYVRRVYSYPAYSHQHHSRCDHRVVVRHYERPRYVYYADYDVYYDCHREVYISYSGRSWTISTSLPVVMHRVDIRRASCREVRYYEDDFVSYLDRGRPMYGEVVVRW